jgi:integrase
MTLAYAGCRLSEALTLTVDRIDLAAGVLVFETPKKRQAGIFRAVPVPPALLCGCSTACQRRWRIAQPVDRDRGRAKNLRR